MAEINTPVHNIGNTFKGKKVLFLENDSELDEWQQGFSDVLLAQGVEQKSLLNLQKVPFAEIIKEINEADAIVFHTQWVYKISSDIAELMKTDAIKSPKIVVEVYLTDPTWFYQPEWTEHQLYILKYDSTEERVSKFFKLSEEPYWYYENKFDK